MKLKTINIFLTPVSISLSVYKLSHITIDNKNICVNNITEINAIILGLIINIIDRTIKGINKHIIVDFNLFDTLLNTENNAIKVATK